MSGYAYSWQVDIPSLELNNGFVIPMVGLGTAGLTGRPNLAAVSTALRAGYRMIDTASRYSNERSVGLGVQASGVPREEIIVQTKLGGGDQGFDETINAAMESARRLGVPRIDIYLIHWPCPSLGRTADSWKALLTLADEGFIRTAGVSNFKEHHLQAIYDETGRWPALNQIKCSPAFPRTELRKFMTEKGIHTQAWSPTGRKDGLLGDAVLIRLARKYGKSPAQISLRWAVQHEISVVPKSSHGGRQLENADVFDFELDDADLADLATLDRGENVAPDSDVEEQF